MLLHEDRDIVRSTGLGVIERLGFDKTNVIIERRRKIIPSICSKLFGFIQNLCYKL